MNEPQQRTTERARRLAPALLALWGWRVVAATLVATPFALELGAAGAAASNSDDRELFQPGLMLALEVVRRAGSDLGASLKAGLTVGLALSLLGLLPLAAWLSALAAPERRPLREHFSRGAAIFPCFLGLSVTVLLAQCAWLLGSSLLAAGLGASLGSRGRAPALAPLAAYGIGLLGVLALGVLLDLARVAAVRAELGVRASLSVAMVTLRRRGSAACAAYFACAGGSLLVLAAAALATERLDLSQPGAWRVATVFITHQLALLALVALRAVWLARAVELVEKAS